MQVDLILTQEGANEGHGRAAAAKPCNSDTLDSSAHARPRWVCHLRWQSSNRNLGATMTISIDAEWHRPISLVDGWRVGKIYDCPNIEDVPKEAGVYVFCRQHGRRVSPLYIGRSGDLRRRLEQHLDSVRLMRALEDAATGSRLFLYCTIRLKRGQRQERVLKVLEDALIAHALAEDHELLQKQGTKRPAHSIAFIGNRVSEAVAPRKLMVRAA